MRRCHEGECRADQFHTRPHLRPVSTYLWAEDPSDACDRRHSARNPHSARFQGSVHHPDRGMPAAASGPPAAPSPPSAFGQWNVVSLLPLSWAPVSARGQAWISRWRRGAPPVVPPKPPAGGRAQPRAAQPAGWPAGDRRGRAESSRTATHLAHPRRPRNEGCSLFNATPCGALGDAASLWSQLADAAWTGLRPQWRDRRCEPRPGLPDSGSPSEIPFPNLSFSGSPLSFLFFFPFLVRWGQGRVFETKHSIFLS